LKGSAQTLDAPQAAPLAFLGRYTTPDPDSGSIGQRQAKRWAQFSLKGEYVPGDKSNCISNNAILHCALLVVDDPESPRFAGGLDRHRLWFRHAGSYLAVNDLPAAQVMCDGC
jgi:hypothetical protein